MTLPTEIQERADKLGQLLGRSNMPADMLQAIQEDLPNLTVRQVDLLIDALEREQVEWERLESMFDNIEEDQGKRSEELASKQVTLTKQYLSEVLEKEEGQELAHLRKTLGATDSSAKNQ
jgi:hypothetical protein